MSGMTLATGYLSERPQRPIPHYQRQLLREEFAKELFPLRVETGFKTRHELARAAKVSLTTIAALEEGRWTEKHVTVLALHKIAAALSRAIVMSVDGREKYFDVDTPLEEVHALGAKISFALDG